MSRSTAPPASSPPAVLGLLGHPVRWRLLGELATSDRTVHELTARVDAAQNLVSYHLGKLRAAGLVTSRRSAADGRDTYYAIDLARVGHDLADTAGALHPGLGRGAPGPPPSSPAPASVLFLCTGNSARSQMAEALTVHRSGGAVHARSAGSQPKPLHPLAVRIMRDDYGIDLAGNQSKHLDGFTDQHFDRVITLCDKVREVCPEFPGVHEPVHWSIADPATADDVPPPAAFRRAAAALDARVAYLLAALPTDAPAS